MAARTFWIACVASFAVLAACSSDDGDDDDDDADASVEDAGRLDATTVVDATSDTGTPVQDAATDAAPGFDAGIDFSSSPLLINEISGGDEWIELVNSDATELDVGGLVLADRDKDTGEPKLSEAVTFPAGTKLAAHAYLLVRGGGIDSKAKPCPGPDAGQCFHAEFGISNKNGETLFLLDAAATVIGKVVYPAGASQGAFSYSRVPDADPSAAFATVKETPGAPNE